MNLLIDLAIPAIILSQLSAPGRLGPVWALVLALSIPVGRGAWSLYRERKVRPTAALGFVSVLAIGLIAALQLPPEWVAVKEGAVPLGVAVVLGVAQHRGKNLAAGILLATIDVERVRAKLVTPESDAAYNALLSRVGVVVTSAFLVSAVVNFAVAKVIVTAQPNTAEFNEQFALTSVVSYVATIASAGIMIIGGHLYLLRGLRELTGMPMLEVLKGSSSPS